ncbi:MAG TPA: hypothetical protein VH916_05455, partial [Dehalococcoidia bacterium]
VWTNLVARLALSYLQPVLGNAVLGLVRLALREQSARQLFHTRSGYVQARWEQWVAFASIGLTLLSLPLGLLYLWRRYRRRTSMLALALAVFVYPLTLALRLTAVGAETSNRASEFVFVAIGLVAAVGLVEQRFRGWLGRPIWLLLPLAAAVLFAGGLIVGTAPWSRLPGPYLVGADDRSIDPEGIAAADWMRTTNGPDNRVAADRYGTLLLGSFGEQRVVTGLLDRIPGEMIDLFTSPTMGPHQLQTVARGQIRYLEFDQRITQELPRGVYFDDDPPRTEPISQAAVAKFDNNSGVSRLYDSGNIVLYDIGGLRDWP